MNQVFDFKGKKIPFFSEWVQGVLWVHVNGKTFTVNTSAGKKSRKESAGIAHNKVLAPMPGKVTKIFVQVGQVVQKGQVVAVMEAMKMEYTLKADLPGPIKKIFTTVGAQVSLGDTLVEITEVEK